jgi:hypothetical protein
MPSPWYHQHASGHFHSPYLHWQPLLRLKCVPLPHGFVIGCLFLVRSAGKPYLFKAHASKSLASLVVAWTWRGERGAACDRASSWSRFHGPLLLGIRPALQGPGGLRFRAAIGWPFLTKSPGRHGASLPSVILLPPLQQPTSPSVPNTSWTRWRFAEKHTQPWLVKILLRKRQQQPKDIAPNKTFLEIFILPLGSLSFWKSFPKDARPLPSKERRNR